MKLILPQFETKKELYKYLVANKADLIQLKQTNANKHADATVFEANSGNTIKSLSSSHLPKDRPEDGVIYRSVVANTYFWLDSHGDVHDKGIFTKSIQENKSRIRHTHDHVQAITAKVANVLDIYEKEVLWSDLNVNKAGSTICLMSDSEIERDRNKQIYRDYLNNEIDQHSVEMIYGKMTLAINDKDEKEEYKEWQRVFPLLGNPEKALEEGFFFVQKESKLKAFSCVVEASCSLTPTVQPEAVKDTSANIEPSKDTQPIDFSKINFITIKTN